MKIHTFILKKEKKIYIMPPHYIIQSFCKKKKKEKKRNQLIDLCASILHDTVLFLLALENRIFNFVVLIAVSQCRFYCCHFGELFLLLVPEFDFLLRFGNFSHISLSDMFDYIFICLFLPGHCNCASVGVLNIVKHLSNYSHFFSNWIISIILYFS